MIGNQTIYTPRKLYIGVGIIRSGNTHRNTRICQLVWWSWWEGGLPNRYNCVLRTKMRVHPLKTNMTMEKQPFEDVSPMKRWWCSISTVMLVFSGVGHKSNHLKPDLHNKRHLFWINSSPKKSTPLATTTTTKQKKHWDFFCLLVLDLCSFSKQIQALKQQNENPPKNLHPLGPI